MVCLGRSVLAAVLTEKNIKTAQKILTKALLVKRVCSKHLITTAMGYTVKRAHIF